VNVPVDHTQRDAENIEHILGPELARELEEKYEPRNG
jgi:Mn-dependent DtxR family transcriptional regulator